MPWPATTAGILVAVVVLVGCHTGSPTTTESTTPGPTNASAAGDTQAAPASAPVVWSDGATGTAPTPGRLGLDEASRDLALALAEQALALYARPGVPLYQWWDDLEPLLSAQGVLAYSTVDPGNIPVRAVTGDASLAGWDTPEVARVTVPTDVGGYLVVVSRADTDPVWRVERFIAPEVLATNTTQVEQRPGPTDHPDHRPARLPRLPSRKKNLSARRRRRDGRPRHGACRLRRRVRPW